MQMTLALFTVHLYHTDYWNINPFHTCSAMANLQRLYIKCVMRLGSHVILAETIDQKLLFTFNVCHSMMTCAVKTEAMRKRMSGKSGKSGSNR